MHTDSSLQIKFSKHDLEQPFRILNRAALLIVYKACGMKQSHLDSMAVRDPGLLLPEVSAPSRCRSLLQSWIMLSSCRFICASCTQAGMWHTGHSVPTQSPTQDLKVKCKNPLSSISYLLYSLSTFSQPNDQQEPLILALTNHYCKAHMS